MMTIDLFHLNVVLDCAKFLDYLTNFILADPRLIPKFPEVCFSQFTDLPAVTFFSELEALFIIFIRHSASHQHFSSVDY